MAKIVYNSTYSAHKTTWFWMMNFWDEWNENRGCFGMHNQTKLNEYSDNDGSHVKEVFHHFLCRSILLLCEFLFFSLLCENFKNRTVFDAIAKELIQIIHSQLEHQQCSNILRIDDDWIEIKRPNEIWKGAEKVTTWFLQCKN